MAAEMTQEQLIATFGEEVGKQMYTQMQASSGGNRAPFTFVKKVYKHTDPLGKFGDFLINVETEKGDGGEYVVTNKGTNLEDSFEFLIVNVSYRYSKYVEATEKTYKSNIFETLDGIKTAVDMSNGKPLPETKEEKKADGWKLVRINAGLIRKNSKAKWTPAIWEVKGALYYSLGELINGQPGNGLLSGIVKAKFEIKEKGTTLYVVVKGDESSFAPLPKDLFSKDETKEMLSDITKKMTEYRKGAQYSGGAAAPQGDGAPSDAGHGGEGDEDKTNW